MDADDAVILEYQAAQPEIADVIALLEELRAELNALGGRVDALEAGDGTDGSAGTDGSGEADGATGDSTTAASRPAAPRARGSVETVFPDWMRDGRPPDQIDNKNREVVRWRGRRRR